MTHFDKMIENFSINDRSPYGRPILDLNMVSNPQGIFTKLVKQDHGLDSHKKQSIFTMLNSPEIIDHLLVGAVGMALTHAVTKFLSVPKPAQTLLSLAGFGIGNILYNIFQDNKFTDYNPDTAKSRIKL